MHGRVFGNDHRWRRIGAKQGDCAADQVEVRKHQIAHFDQDVFQVARRRVNEKILRLRDVVFHLRAIFPFVPERSAPAVRQDDDRLKKRLPRAAQDVGRAVQVAAHESLLQFAKGTLASVYPTEALRHLVFHLRSSAAKFVNLNTTYGMVCQTKIHMLCTTCGRFR
jgi:hypothetical protein